MGWPFGGTILSIKLLKLPEPQKLYMRSSHDNDASTLLNTSWKNFPVRLQIKVKLGHKLYHSLNLKELLINDIIIKRLPTR